MKMKAASLIHRLLLGLALGFLWAPTVSAAPVSSQGSEFWLAFPTQYQVPSYPQALDLFILSQTGASGQVSIAGLSYGQAFSVSPNSAVTVTVPEAAMLSAADGVQPLAVHVTSDNDITVFGLEYEQYATDGYLALPTGAIGTQYWVASYTADINQNATTTISSTEFAVAAAQDSTSVTITPSQAVGSHPAGVPFTVSLNRGEAYQLQDDLLGSDLTGTQVSSNLPVALFSANACTDVPVSFVTCNLILEQEIPLATWGSSFITVPLAGRSMDSFRFLAASNGTVVSINGAAVATLNQGQFFEQMLSAASYVTSTAPILVMQYSTSHTYDNAAMGDPCQITVSPIADYGTAYQLAAPATGFSLNYLNLSAPSTEAGSILLDGTAIAAGSFVTVGTSGYSAAQVTIGPGYHKLSGSAPFGVESYGFDIRDAYGYPGGLVFTSLPTLTPTPSPTITPTPVPPTPVCEVKIWPVPFNPGKAVGGTLKMDCLQPGDQVSFYTLAGEKVFQVNSLGGQFNWDGTNKQGISVTPGIYFYAVVRNGNVVKRDKFIIVK